MEERDYGILMWWFDGHIQEWIFLYAVLQYVIQLEVGCIGVLKTLLLFLLYL